MAEGVYTLNRQNSQGGGGREGYYPQLTDGETEAQRDEVACSRPHGKSVAEQRNHRKSPMLEQGHCRYDADYSLHPGFLM